jgi:hypothetical protein
MGLLIATEISPEVEVIGAVMLAKSTGSKLLTVLLCVSLCTLEGTLALLEVKCYEYK